MTAVAAHPGRERVLGWDALRGLCALAVALYHLLYWQGVATLNTLGSYGVYMFFVLSGASLAYNYSGRLRRRGDYPVFLLTRWLRLAPLYLVVCLGFVVLYSAKDVLSGNVPLKLLLNATFAFGLYDPAYWALPIGGWSLGIEFVYYLVFPLLMLAMPSRHLSAAVFVVLAVLQWSWLYRTAGSDAGYASSAVAYHQVPAFAAYFFGGCLIGHWRSLRDPGLSQSVGLAAWSLAAAVLLLLNPVNAGDELLGWRGASLFAVCFAAVAISGHVRVGQALGPVARWLGDVTYGCYLLHPLFFFSLAWFVLPHLGWDDITQAPLTVRWGLILLVLGLSCGVAWASERWFEAPVRNWGKRVLGRRIVPAPKAYKDAANISS